MAAQLEVLNDAGQVITNLGFGAIDGGANVAQKLSIKNQGDGIATSVVLSLTRIATNDGLDYVQLAPDNGGNPSDPVGLSIPFGTIEAGASVQFWVKVTIPAGTTPAGNPRNFDIIIEYTGT